MKDSPSPLKAALVWLGLSLPSASEHAPHVGHGGDHGHTHGVIDPTIASTTKGIWAIKWSFAILAVTALFQLAVVLVTGSVALLADTIHNVGDAVTAVPLWIAFMLARRKPSARFTYGYGRVEDLAGVAIVLIILLSAIVAGYEAVSRLIHPQPVAMLGWVALAGFIGFVGNEAVAVFRIRVGRQINSAALIADGYHARTDGLTSLAVVGGAVGVYLGFPLADPIIGLLITLAIFGIVWQSAKAVFTRMLDGVEPEIPAEIRHAAEHVPGIRQVLDVRARWSGHRLNAELDVAMDGTVSLSEADAVAAQFEHQLFEHVPALAAARIRVRPYDAASTIALVDHSGQGHHHAPAPVSVQGELATGEMEIIDTPQGERMQFKLTRTISGLTATVVIERLEDKAELLELFPTAEDSTRFLSQLAPAEPHEFSAVLRLRVGDRFEDLAFRMEEPLGHAAH